MGTGGMMIRLFLGFDYALMLGSSELPEKHSHKFLHIIIGLSGSFEISLFDGESIRCDGIIIDEDVPHCYESTLDDILVFLIDNTSSIARSLKTTYLNETPYHLLYNAKIEEIRNCWHRLFKHPACFFPKKITQASAKTFQICGLSLSGSIKDKRIIQAIGYLDKCEGIYGTEVEALSELFHLSKSRLTHLFKEQTGISIRSFLLQMKLYKTYLYCNQGTSLTQAAVRAGFDSLSHFSATNKKMFGFALSFYRKEIEFILL